MNKSFFITWIVVFIVWMAGSFLIHGLWLGSTYESMTAMFRPMEEQNELFPFMLLAHVIMAGAFVWIYQRGREDKPWLMQGVRFGIAVALLAAIPTYMIYYTVQPTPGSLAVNQMVGDTVLLIVLGVVAAALNKSPSA